MPQDQESPVPSNFQGALSGGCCTDCPRIFSEGWGKGPSSPFHHAPKSLVVEKGDLKRSPGKGAEYLLNTGTVGAQFALFHFFNESTCL